MRATIWRIWIPLAVLALSVSSCDGRENVVTEVSSIPTTVTVTPSSATLRAIGDTLRFSAQVRDQSGAIMDSVAVTWATNTPLVASIDGAGLATAISAGTATITATAGSASGAITLAVIQALASVSVTPEAVTLYPVGATQQFEAVAVDANGHPVVGATFEWSSSDGEVVTVDQGGLAIAQGPGSAWIIAGAEARRDSASATVVKPGPLTLLPSDWRMPVGAQVQFRARFDEWTEVEGVWFVNDVPGGNEGVGTIDSEGLYTAPLVIPAGGEVTVRVMEASDPTNYADAPVTISTGDEEARILWHVWTPRVINTNPADSATYEVSFSGYPSFELERLSGERLIPAAIRTGIYGFEFSNSEVLEGYDDGDLHNFVGYLNCEGCARVTRGNVHVNVLDALVPSTSVTLLGEEVQAASNIVNIRYDHLFLAGSIPTEILQTFYTHFPDDFDFVGVIEQVNSFNNRTYRGLRNDTEGLGLTNYDFGGQYGSPARLQGLVSYPISTYFDAAGKATVHEIGHRWMVFLDNQAFSGSGAHWPLSSMARGIMGRSGYGGQGVDFWAEVRGLGGDMFEIVCTGPSFEYNDLELYLMGLLPPDSVSTHVIFRDQAMSVECGASGPADPITVQEIIAENGTREPVYGSARSEFRFATIVLSTGRLLSPEEMAFFNHMAARGEATTELHFTSGFWEGTTKPFYLATGGRGTLSTRVFE